MRTVAVMGCGTVGSGVIKMLVDNQDVIARAAGERVALKYAMDLRTIDVPEGCALTQNFDDILNDPDVSIAVETIGGCSVAYKFTKALLQAGKSVVSSNKELVAEHGDELTAIARARGCGYLYEASVGGGVPILRPIRTCLSGNHVVRIEGIVNGSTNYLLTRMEELGMSFPAALAEAQQLGYAELNPAADIEGWDAKRKLAILANAAFGSELSDHAAIQTEGIARVTERDLRCARALGGAVKLIAHAERKGDSWIGWVHPAMLKEDHPLYRVRDVYNGILVSGDYVQDVLFQGRGAGSLPTASAILGDVIELCRGGMNMLEKPAQAPRYQAPDGEEAQLMVRIESEHPQRLDAVIRTLVPGARLTPVDDMIALVTERAPLGQLLQALRKLDPEVARTGIPLRIL